MGPSDGHPYSLLLDLTKLLIILHEQQSPKLSTAFQTQSLQCRSSLDLLAAPSSMWPSIGFPGSQGDCAMAHIHIGTHRGPWYFEQGCGSGSHFPAVLVCEVILPQVQSFAVLLIKLWEFLLL